MDKGRGFKRVCLMAVMKMWTCVVLAVYAVSECNAYLFPDFRNIWQKMCSFTVGGASWVLVDFQTLS